MVSGGSWDIRRVYRTQRTRRCFLLVFVWLVISNPIPCLESNGSLLQLPSFMALLLVTGPTLRPQACDYEPSRVTSFWTVWLAPGYVIKVSQSGECFKCQRSGHFSPTGELKEREWRVAESYVSSAEKSWKFIKAAMQDRIIMVSEALIPEVPKASCLLLLL